MSRASADPAHRHVFRTGRPFWRDGECLCEGKCACGETCERPGDLETALRWKSRRPRSKVVREEIMPNSRNTLLARGRELKPVREAVRAFIAARPLQHPSLAECQQYITSQGWPLPPPQTVRTWLVGATARTGKAHAPKPAPTERGAQRQEDELLFLRGYRSAVREIFGAKGEG